MNLFLIKSIIAIFLFVAGFASALSMLTLMGKSEKTADPAVLKKIHKAGGRLFAVLTLANSVLGFVYFARAGDTVPTRAVIHVYLALALNAVLFLKIAIVKAYRQLLRLAPALGLTVFALAFVIVIASAGFFVLKLAVATPAAAETGTVSDSSAPAVPVDARRGAAVFQSQCASCHFADREDRKAGPGLKNILRHPTLPVSGRPATEENIRRQLREPVMAMPAFPALAGPDLTDLMTYLKTL